ncbi:MAG TPA: RecX family transcriptional regulator [Anaerolineae bacterium]|jgi:regulatory protein|nr:RecX family transcriptional regulator [Anaerolineae bacterium]
MAGTITKLSFQKRNSERVNVHLDGRYAFALPDIEAAKLKRGQFLSDVEITQLRALDARQRAYERVLRLLSHRPRSEVEVQRYLKRKETPPEVIDEVLERLQREGYLDDAAFVRFWVENRERHNPRGVWALRQELRQKGVAGPLIESALEGLDTEDGAYRALDRRRRRWQGMAYADYRRLAGSYLTRRGFDYAVARDALEKMWAEIAPEDVRE